MESHPSSLLGRLQNRKDSIEVVAGIDAWKQISVPFRDTINGLLTIRQFGILAIALLSFIVIDRKANRTLGESPLHIIGLALWGVVVIFIDVIGENERGESGRDRFKSGPLAEARRRTQYLYKQSVGKPAADWVERVQRRDPDAPLSPELDKETSVMLIGTTGTGKSTFMKNLAGEWWSFEDAILAHTVSEEGVRNELAEFFAARGRHVIQLSSRNSDMRWDPFLDYDGTMQNFSLLARRLFEASESESTGWSDPAETMLVGVLAVAKLNHDDFAKLPAVINQDRQLFLEELEQLVNQDQVAIQAELQSLRDLGPGEFRTTRQYLFNELRPIFHSDICDESLPALSLEAYLEDPGDRVVVLDNLENDDTQVFWRVLFETAIKISFRSTENQRFLLDEFTKIPAVKNLDSLVSRGRSEDATAMLVTQDVHQIEETYGRVGRSIWANCPNNVCFRPGDSETAEFALSAIGEYEMVKKDVAESSASDASQRTRSTVTQKPIESSRLMDCDTGEALIRSKNGWWLCQLSDYSMDE